MKTILKLKLAAVILCSSFLFSNQSCQNNNNEGNNLSTEQYQLPEIISAIDPCDFYFNWEDITDLRSHDSWLRSTIIEKRYLTEGPFDGAELKEVVLRPEYGNTGLYWEFKYEKDNSKIAHLLLDCNGNIELPAANYETLNLDWEEIDLSNGENLEATVVEPNGYYKEKWLLNW